MSDYSEMTQAELYEVAARLKIQGRSNLSKPDLLAAVEAASASNTAEVVTPEPVPPKPAAAPKAPPSRLPPVPAPKAVEQAEPPTRYLVTKDAKFTKDGVIHRLAAGSIITELTHDFAALKVHDVQLQEVEGDVSVGRSQMGFPVTTVGGKPVDVRKMKGS